MNTADQLPAETPAADQPRWQRRYDQTRQAFAAAGIRTHADVEAGRRQYVKNRRKWDQQLGAFAAFTGYDWEEITGDRDLQDATDDPNDSGR